MDIAMGNQQVTQTDLAWLAGIWDGEGTISIRRVVQKKAKTPQYSPRVCVVNTDTKIISKVRSLLDSIGVRYYFAERDPGSFPGSNKQQWVISIDTLSHAKTFLVHIRPYLIGKSFQADCILEFCERRLKVANRKMHNNNVRAYDEKDYKLVENVYIANGDIRGTSETVRQDAHRAMIQSELPRDGKTWSEKAMRHY
jgi:hypothetical protein